MHDNFFSIGSNSESLSRSASESSVSTGTGTGVGGGGPGGGAVTGRVAGGSPESGLGGELAQAHPDHANGDADHEHDNDQDERDSEFDYYYCEPDLQPVGHCKALYAFEG